VNIQVEAGTGNVEGNVLAWQRKCGGLMIVVGGVAYMMQSFLFYNLNNHPELNPETKEMYFFTYLHCHKGASGRTPTLLSELKHQELVDY